MSLRTSVMGGLAGVTCGRVSAVEEASLWEGRLAVNIWEGNGSELPQVHVHMLHVSMALKQTVYHVQRNVHVHNTEWVIPYQF